MKTKMLCGMLIGTLALAGTAMGQTRDVTFSVNMGVRITAGTFDPATMTVEVRGGFNGWAAGSTLARVGETTVYAGTFAVAGAEGVAVEYKFRSESPEAWENDPNRSFNLGPADTPQVLDTVYFNNQGPVGPEVTANVTFSVDMAVRMGSGAFDPDTMGVDVRGDFNGWGQTALAREGETSIYSATISVTTNEGASVGYKFYYHSGVDNWENDPNRTFLMSADPQVLDTVYFNNEEPILIGLTLDGTWNPDATGDYPFTLSRVGAVGDEIVLTSSNPDAVTVPAGATFVSNSVSFDATVVSLTNGPATIVASNEATGVWTDYVITPVPPVLSIDGPRDVYAFPSPLQYTLTRQGAVGDAVNLSSSDAGVLRVPATATFAAGQTQTTFFATSAAYGVATILASNAFAQATIDVTVTAPAIALTGPDTVWNGSDKYYVVYRNSAAYVGDSLNLTSSDPNLLTVPATVEFPAGQNRAFFQATGVATGTVTITADNDDVEPVAREVAVADLPGILATDEAGNYTVETFTNGANRGMGFNAWDLRNTPAELGDSTAGGGGDLNSTNGVSFRFMGDGLGGYCNGQRDFARALKIGDALSFTFTYNWDGGNRGVDVFSASGQFANLINVSSGDVFKVNGATVSTEYSPGAVVEVEITQKADGIEVYLTRATNGTVNLAYVTNVVHGEPATGVAMYCGGYTAAPIEDNVNFAIFMNDVQIAGVAPTILAFSGGTWDPAATGDYPFELTRSGAVGDDVVLTSDNEAAVTVPAGVTFVSNQVSFNATVVSLTAGSAKIVASNVASGAWAEYDVYPVAPSLGLDGPWLVEGLGEVQYTLTRSASTGNDIDLYSSDESVLTVPGNMWFNPSVYSGPFPATAVGYGTATITATDTVSGAWATYDVTVQAPAFLPIPDITFVPATGNFTFPEPFGYDLFKVYGADCVPNAAEGWDWVELVLDTDYTVADGVVTILTDAAERQIIRVSFIQE